jgi:tetratricopeptide (TPR) repeat protein
LSAPLAPISNSLGPLRDIHGSLRLAASGAIPAGAVRTKYVRRVRAAGNAALPTLLRALSSENDAEASWASYLLGRLGGARVTDRLAALVEDREVAPATRRRALALLSDLDVELAASPAIDQPDASLLERSVSALVGRLDRPEDLDEAVALIVSQIPEGELSQIAAELSRHRDPRGRALIERLAVQVALQPETRAELRQILALLDGHGEGHEEPSRGDRRRPLRPTLESALDDLEAGRTQRARRALERLATRSPDRPEVRSALGVCLLELDEVARAIDHLCAAATLEPDEALHQWNVASAMKSAERVGGCYLALRKYLAADDRSDGASERLAEARRFVRGYEQMLQLAHPAVSLGDSLRGEALFAEAHAALEEGRADEARLGFEAVLRLQPQHHPSWALLGSAFVALGLRGDAHGCLSRALELLPGYAPAVKQLVLLEDN